MYTSTKIEANTLDDLLRKTYSTLLEKCPTDFKTSRGNISHELLGATLVLNNPRARLSTTETKGKLFSALGEFLWYLAKSNDPDFITYYISCYKDEVDDNGKINGAYGPRIFNMNGIDQFNSVIELLKSKPNTRRAVIQIYRAEDLNPKLKEVPCTTMLQFFNRDDKLQMFVSMRSNDAYLGLSHDIFSFTMLQELIACELNLGLGNYYHSVGSLHIYKEHLNKVDQYINEGWQPTVDISMPVMPKGSLRTIESVLLHEENIRCNNAIVKIEIDNYWSDFIGLLKIFSCYKNENFKLIKEINDTLSHELYKNLVEEKYILNC